MGKFLDRIGMVGLWAAIVVLLCAIFGLLIFFVSGDRIEDSTVEDLLEWDAQDHLEDLAEDEELLLEEEQDTQELMDLLYLDEDEEVF